MRQKDGVCKTVAYAKGSVQKSGRGGEVDGSGRVTSSIQANNKSISSVL